MTIHDRELLERAARAVGVELLWSSEPGWAPKLRDERKQSWNPLDDGDALRLAVTLGMGTGQGFEMAFATLTVLPADDIGEARHAEAHEKYSDHDGDIYAASRRAIVRVAAAMDMTP